MNEKKGVCYCAYVVGYVEDNGDFVISKYYGKESIANVAIDIAASGLINREDVYSHWVVESTKQKLEDKIDNWHYDMYHHVKRLAEGV